VRICAGGARQLASLPRLNSVEWCTGIAGAQTLAEIERQFGRLSLFKKAAYRGSLCKFFSRGSIFI